MVRRRGDRLLQLGQRDRQRLAVTVGLGWLGSKPAEGGYVIAARILTFYYFAHFFIILPVLGWVERTKPLPNSISESILTSKRVTG